MQNLFSIILLFINRFSIVGFIVANSLKLFYSFLTVEVYCISFVITSAKEVIKSPAFIYLFVCLSVCLSVCEQFYVKTNGPIFMKFSGEVDMGHGTNPLIFGQGRVRGQGPGH